MVSGSFWVASDGFSWFQPVSGGLRWFQVVPRFSKYDLRTFNHSEHGTMRRTIIVCIIVPYSESLQSLWTYNHASASIVFIISMCDLLWLTIFIKLGTDFSLGTKFAQIYNLASRPSIRSNSLYNQHVRFALSAKFHKNWS